MPDVGEPQPTNTAPRRLRASELAATYPEGSTMREFYDRIVKAIDGRTAFMQVREEELFGEDWLWIVPVR